LGRMVGNGSGDVASLGNVIVGGSSAVIGDVRPGASGTVVDAGGNSYVAGDIDPITIPPYLPAVDYLPPPIPNPTLKLTNVQTMVLNVAVVRFASIELQGSASLNVATDVTMYVDGDLVIGGNARVVIEPGASVLIWQGGGEVKVTGAGIVNLDESPPSLIWVSGSAEDFLYSGNADFHGAIYAPEARVNVNAGDAYGAIVGRTIDAGGSIEWHYDESLVNVFPFAKPPLLPVLWLE